MIAHLVTITWKDGGHPDAAALAQSLRDLVATVDSIVFYRVGENLGIRPNGADFGVLAVGADRAGLEAYLDHPEHLRIVSENMAPYIGTRQAVQLEFGEVGFDELTA